MIEMGSRVKLHYTGSIEDGRVFYSTVSQGGVPVEITLGKHEVLPALEAEIATMEVGDRKTVVIPAKDAYGEFDPTLKEVVPVSEFPNADKLPVGQYIGFNTEQGPVRVKVESMTDDEITFDYNHELAGHDITFKVDVLAAMSASERPVEQELFYREDECGCKSLLGHDHDHGHDHDGACCHS